MKFSLPRYTQRKKFQRQLQILRSIVPSRGKAVTTNRWASLVLDAADYIMEMREQIRQLSSDIQMLSRPTTLENSADLEYLDSNDSQDNVGTPLHGGHVEVLEKEEGLELHLTCEKSPGVLVAVMEALEGSGLIFVKLKIQCSQRLQLDAFGAQNCEGQFVEAEVVRELLVRTILKASDGNA